MKMKTFSQKKNIAQMKKENIQDGDYVYAPSDIRGIYFVRFKPKNKEERRSNSGYGRKL